MTKQNIPFLTLGLVATMLALHFLAAGKALLYFSHADIMAGEYWRLVSGHLVHADVSHLLWNCLGLMVLGALIERNSRIVWWSALLVGIGSVSTWLLSPFSQLDYYIGLSGALNTMLMVALWQEWRDRQSWWIAAVFVACLAKVVFEIYTGDSLLTTISWPPYAWAHVAGLLGGVILVCSSQLVQVRTQSSGLVTRR